MRVTNTLPNTLFLGACIAIIASACYAFIPTSDTASLLGSDLATKKNHDPSAKPQFKITDYLIKSGDSLSLIFAKFDIPKQNLHNIVHANDMGKEFASIMPGKTLRFKTTQEGVLQQLNYPKNLSETLIAKRFGESFSVEKLSKEIKYRTASAQVHIRSSLFLDGKKAGLSDKLIRGLTQIFAWEIDFASDLRVNDQLTVVYENKFIDGLVVGTGDILAVEFINRGHNYQAVRYQDEQGKNYYYTPEGKSLKRTFLRSPIEFSRISSRFNLRRKHPILNRIRAHKGVDYAARTGTPIKTTGNGKIIFRGRKGGYGKTVIIQHSNGYRTLYAHLLKFKRGQKMGSRVAQGSTIGYVGQTGLATGPHLHYEFQINGRHRNPLKVVSPKNPPITQSKLAAFKSQTQPLLAQLNQVKPHLLVAKIDW